MPNITTATALNPQIAAQAAQGMGDAQSKNLVKVKTTAKNFEAMYMQEMLQHMWEGVDTNGPMGGGRGEEVFRSLMVDQYGKIIADSGQTKISDTLTKQMLRLQEQQQNPRNALLGKAAATAIKPGESHE